MVEELKELKYAQIIAFGAEDAPTDVPDEDEEDEDEDDEKDDDDEEEEEEEANGFES